MEKDGRRRTTRAQKAVAFFLDILSKKNSFKDCNTEW